MALLVEKIKQMMKCDYLHLHSHLQLCSQNNATKEYLQLYPNKFTGSFTKLQAFKLIKRGPKYEINGYCELLQNEIQCAQKTEQQKNFENNRKSNTNECVYELNWRKFPANAAADGKNIEALDINLPHEKNGFLINTF